MTLECVEVETAPSPRHAVIWLHGLGADGHDFEPVVPQLVQPGWPALRFVFPHAAVRPISLNGGLPMRGWYDIAGFDLAQKQDERGIRASIGEVETLIAREVSRGVDMSHIVLAGFSQGGAIALAAGLRHAQKLAAIVALSTYLPIDSQTANERSDANAATSIFIAHGTFDPVVAQVLGERSRDRLRDWGYTVDWHSYPMAHQVCPQEIADLADFLGPRIASR
ncbi:MAG TPA: alpha/beta hydrolase fold domain-containing protein [Rhodanobacteraceae bacterium]|nr:alpha/beta hydrolase fold domain-containing protein [Rhodanobacteraceae bacterium]